jgi:subtilisin-like proprotein convertase family protein
VPITGTVGSTRKKAATLARPPRPRYVAIHTAVQDVSIQDMRTSKLSVAVGDEKPLKSIKVIVDIEHTYIGDLVVQLKPPSSMGASPVLLHDKFGGGTDNIKRTFDGVNTPELSTLLGKNPQGSWTLEVEDTARADTGKIRKFTVELGL